MTVTNFDKIDASRIIRRLHAQGSFNGKRYLFERIELDDGFVAERNFILTSTGWEETKVNPSDGECVELTFDAIDPSGQYNKILIRDRETGEILRYLHRIKPFTFAGAFNLIIKAEEQERWQEEEKRLENLRPTQDDFENLVSKIQSKPSFALATTSEFVDELHNKKLSAKRKFFKGIDYEIEFGVSRLISDRVYHLPKLLEKLELTSVQNKSYKLCAKESTAAGIVGLEYYFEASNDEEAKKVSVIFKQKIAGVGER